MIEGRLAGRAALITGAADGVGQGIARRFAKEGAAVMVVDFDAEKGVETTEELKALGARAEFFRADVTSKAMDNGDTVEEYRVGGVLRMVKVTPARGAPFYMYDRDGDGRGPIEEILDGPDGTRSDRRGDVGLDPHGGDAAYDRDVTYDRDRAYDDGPLLDSDRDGRGPIEEVLDGPDDPTNPRRN